MKNVTASCDPTPILDEAAAASTRRATPSVWTEDQHARSSHQEPDSVRTRHPLPTTHFPKPRNFLGKASSGWTDARMLDLNHWPNADCYQTEHPDARPICARENPDPTLESPKRPSVRNFLGSQKPRPVSHISSSLKPPASSLPTLVPTPNTVHTPTLQRSNRRAMECPPGATLTI